MPIYEYACPACGRVSSFLVRNTGTHRTPACPRCGACRLRRVLSRFSAPGIRKGRRPAGGGDDAGDESGTEPDIADGLLEGFDENDPRSMGRMMRQLSEQSGEPLDEELDEVTRRLEAGEDPESIEDRMGGNDADGGGDTLYDG